MYSTNFLLLILADEEFDELCFEFGLELDEIVSNVLYNVAECVSYNQDIQNIHQNVTRNHILS